MGPKGDTGAAGASGADGRQGPAGPGAVPVVGTAISGQGTQPLATVGQWTLTLTCSASAPNATVTLTGPGTYAWTANIGTASSVANGSIGGGFHMTVNSGAQLAVDGFLQSGSTVAQLHLQIIAVNGGLFQNCSVVGDAIPVPAA